MKKTFLFLFAVFTVLCDAQQIIYYQGNISDSLYALSFDHTNIFTTKVVEIKDTTLFQVNPLNQYHTAVGATAYVGVDNAGRLIRTAIPSAGVPGTRTITINGNTQDLSANRMWTLTTTDIVEGSNLYYTQGRFDASLAAKSTTNLAEGSNLYFTNARARSAISLTTTGTTGAATYSSATGVLNIPQYGPGAPSTVSRGFSSTTGFQPSTTNSTHVSYTIRIACSLSLTGGTYGAVIMEKSANGSTGWTEVTRCENGNTGTLTVGLNTVQTGCYNIGGIIPAGYFVRLRQATTSGTPTYTYVTGEETPL